MNALNNSSLLVNFRLISYDQLIDVDYINSALYIIEECDDKYILCANFNNIEYKLIECNNKYFLIDLMKEIRIKSTAFYESYNNGIKEFNICEQVKTMSKSHKWMDTNICIK